MIGNPLDATAILGLLATPAAGIFAGAAAYVTFVEHPARVACGSVLAVTEFGPSYKRATIMQAPLALLGAAAGTARWVTGGGVGWLVGAVVLGTVVPFTAVVIFPTNHRLLEASWRDIGGPSVRLATLARISQMTAPRDDAGA